MAFVAWLWRLPIFFVLSVIAGPMDKKQLPPDVEHCFY